MANLRKKVPAFDLTRRKPGRNGAAVAGSTGDRDCVNNNDNGHLDNRPSIPKVNKRNLLGSYLLWDTHVS